MSDERPILPDQTDDDTDVGWGESPEYDPADPADGRDEAERRLLRERPPHYDR